MKKLALDKSYVQELYKEGRSTRQIAIEFNVSRAPINRICKELKIIRHPYDRGIRNLKTHIYFNIFITLNGCWEWTRPIFRYGKIGIQLAHRVSYEAFKGPIPYGLTIDHLCRNTRCVNPKHLEAVSMKENTMRGLAPSAFNARKTHCVRGHRLSGDTLRITRGPYGPKRSCRRCEVIRVQQREN